MRSAQFRILVALLGLVGAVGAATAIVFYLGDRDRLPAPRAAATTTAVTSATATPAGPVPSVSATPAATPARTASPVQPVRGLTVRATSPVNIRGGPGTQFAIIGVLQAGESAAVAGRDIAGDWLLIQQPAGTGWVATGVVDVTGDVTLAPVTSATSVAATATTTVSAGSSPTATAITVAGSATPSRTGTPTATLTATPTPAPSPISATTAPRAGGPLPDIVLQDVAAGAGGRITISIGNAGSGPLTGRRISVVALDEAANVIFSELTPPLTLAPGSASAVELTYQLSTTITLTVILNADGSIEELNGANNRRRVTLTPR